MARRMPGLLASALAATAAGESGQQARGTAMHRAAAAAVSVLLTGGQCGCWYVMAAAAGVVGLSVVE